AGAAGAAARRIARPGDRGVRRRSWGVPRRHRGVVPVAPLRPGAVVALDGRVPQDPPHQIGEPGAVVALAVGGNGVRGAKAKARQIVPGGGAKAVVAGRVHQRGPLAVNGAGDMAASTGNGANPQIFLPAAGIPYPVIGAVEVVDDFLQGCSPPGVKVDVDGGRLALV